MLMDTCLGRNLLPKGKYKITAWKDNGNLSASYQRHFQSKEQIEQETGSINTSKRVLLN